MTGGVKSSLYKWEPTKNCTTTRFWHHKYDNYRANDCTVCIAVALGAVAAALVDPQGPHPSGARCQLQWWQKFSKNWHLMMTEHSLHAAMCGFNFKPDT